MDGIQGETTKQIRRIGKPALKVALHALVYSIPFGREVHIALIVSNRVYSSWKSIEQYQATYQKEGTLSIQNVATDDTTKKLVWMVGKEVICDCIPEDITPADIEISNDVLFTIMDNIPDKDIEYVEQFLK